MDFRCYHRCRRVGAHAAGIGALITIFQPFVILAAGQCQRVAAIGEHDEARFFAVEKFFDHHPCAGRTHLVADQHHVDRGMGFISLHRHHHALACGQTVGLDHNRRTFVVDISMSLRSISKGRVFRRRNAMTHHEVLGEILGAFQLRGFLRRPENALSRAAHGIDHTRGERRLGPNHCQRHIIFINKINDLLITCQRNIVQSVFTRSAGVTRRDKHFLHQRRLRQFPRQRVFAATAADDENFHGVS